MTIAEIRLEQETANDEGATVVAVHVASGTDVAPNQRLFDVENSKATTEVRADVAGQLRHALKVGDVVPFGVVVASIVPAGAAAAAAEGPEPEPEPKPTAPPALGTMPLPVETIAGVSRPEPGPNPAEPRFSHAAAALAAEHGLSPSQFEGDLITTIDVRRRLGVEGIAGARSLPIVRPPTAVERGFGAKRPSSAALPTSSAKRHEIALLSAGAGGTMLSVLHSRLGTISPARDGDDMFAGTITDLVVFESARLMTKYRRLNAAYSGGEVMPFDSVNAGIAFDKGGRLVIYGVIDADRKTLHTLREELADAVARYAEGQLKAEEMSRSTYVVTDLSASKLDFVYPILPEGASCIIGVTRDRAGAFGLSVGFDHRVTEGREVALFMDELGQRLLSFDAPVRGAGATIPACFFCDTPAAEASMNGLGIRGLIRVVTADGTDALCCRNCLEGV